MLEGVTVTVIVVRDTSTIDKSISKGNTYICVCRYNERLKVKTDGSTRLAYTGLSGELEHLKIEKRIVESFGCVMGECVI